ncbi:MAG: TetR/AcrR family transcriptional regulator [Clostridiales bacterium]|nr:TetR/AcrR family transcriptional regulator [Clostridiales bacterium]
MDEEKRSTKQRIIDEALALFSVKGFGNVTVAEIADAVGIKAPSLYKHYTNKHDIFEAIVAEMQSRYEKQAASMQMNGTEAGVDSGLFMDVGEETLIAMGREFFMYFLHDDYMSKFRRMLAIERYGNSDLAERYAKLYMDDPLSYQGLILGALAGAGVFADEDPGIMALHFYAPLFLLLTMCDCHPEREEEALLMLEGHIRQFNRRYKK